MFRRVPVNQMKFCGECAYCDEGQKSVIKFADYVVPAHQGQRLFSGDDVDFTNALFLCEKHFNESKYANPTFHANAGILYISAKRAS